MIDGERLCDADMATDFAYVIDKRPVYVASNGKGRRELFA